MTKSLSFISIVSVFMFSLSCDCEDCGPLVYNPSFNAQFINNDSLAVLSDSSSTLADSSKILSDTINALTAFIAGLTDNDSINTYNNIQTDFTANKVIIDSLSTRITENQDSVSAGWLIINKITNLDNGQSEQPDTLNIYNIPLPLSTGDNSARFELDILRELYYFNVSFTSEESVDDFGDVRLVLTELEVDTSSVTFDTVTVTDDFTYIFEF